MKLPCIWLLYKKSYHFDNRYLEDYFKMWNWPLCFFVNQSSLREISYKNWIIQQVHWKSAKAMKTIGAKIQKNRESLRGELSSALFPWGHLTILDAHKRLEIWAYPEKKSHCWKIKIYRYNMILHVQS